MDALTNALREKSVLTAETTPRLFDLSNEQDRAQLEKLFETKLIQRVSDDYLEQLKELFAIKNPSKIYTPTFESEFADYVTSLGALERQGKWAYFPWISALSHILPEDDFQLVRTARNRNLITQDEQERFFNATIGIAGLSVGSSVALSIVLQGGGKRIKLADMDHLALTNTNRILTGTHELGQLKVNMATRRIYEMNPYAQIETYADGLTKENISEFFKDLDIIVDEIDNIAVKYLIREQAKAHGIAVVMGADNGDNAVVDVERYDLDPNTPFFQGRLGNVTYEELKGLDKFGIGKTITKHIGPENVTVRMQESLLEMGKTIVSWPQLGGAAMINGAAVAYCIRRILNGQSVESNRALISLDTLLIPEYKDPEEQAKRQIAINSFKKVFGL